MIAVVQLANYIIWPFTNIGAIVADVNHSIVSAERLDRILSLIKERKEGRQARRFDSICLQDVSFSYGGESVVSKLSAEFFVGKIIGIVGESGCGKSTLLKLISGLYQPQQGHIEKRESETKENLVPACVGFVPTTDSVLEDSLANNICMSAPIDETRMQKCAAMANLDTYVRPLPLAYGTDIGKGKQELSSGQQQRVGLARAFYQDSNILIFDEPTSNLDDESASVFIKSLVSISSEYICIIATHDDRLKKHCDRLFKMDMGKLQTL